MACIVVENGIYCKNKSKRKYGKKNPNDYFCIYLQITRMSLCNQDVLG